LPAIPVALRAWLVAPLLEPLAAVLEPCPLGAGRLAAWMPPTVLAIGELLAVPVVLPARLVPPAAVGGAEIVPVRAA
jgi:hypothetical protein